MTVLLILTASEYREESEEAIAGSGMERDAYHFRAAVCLGALEVSVRKRT
jgi:hypothetical protein